MSEPQETRIGRKQERIEKPQASSSKPRKVYVLGVAFVAVLLLGASFGIMISATTPNIPTVIEPGSMVSDSSYIIFPSGSSYYAKNGTTGAIDYSSTDAGVVIEYAITALGSQGGIIHLKVGVYNIASFHIDSIYYSIGITSGSSRTIIIQGEGSVPPFQTPPISAGTLLNVTPALYAALPVVQEYSVILARPPQNTLLKATIFIKDLTIRLPYSSREGVCAIDTRYGLQSGIENVVCDFEILDGPGANSAGIVLPMGYQAGYIQRAVNCIVLGWYWGFLIGDYSILDNCAARRGMFPYGIGLLGSPVQCTVTLLHCAEAGTVRSVYLGADVVPNAYIEIIGYNIEFVTAYKISAAFEVNPGYARGFVSYTVQNETGSYYHPFWDSGSGIKFKTVWAWTGSEFKGTASIVDSTSIAFNHNLVTTPTLILCSFNSTAYGAYTWTATATEITITVLNSGYYTVYWYAEV